MNKNEQIKSLVNELLPLLDLEAKNALIWYLEGVKFTLTANHESEQ